MPRFEDFPDEELFILKWQAIESNHTIGMGEKFNPRQKAIHSELLKEVYAESRRRYENRQEEQN